MSRMILRSGRTLRAVLALGALAAAGTLVQAQAQAQDARPRVRAERDDCRCVDRDGNPIENCTCFRTPDVPAIMARVSPLFGSRARLGIRITEERDAGDASRGVRIESVVEDGPADAAGLREDDVITALDGKSLLRPLDRETEESFDLDGSVAVQRLLALLRDVEPEQEVRVDYLRDGDARSTTVTAKELGGWTVGTVLPRWRSDPGEMAEAMADMRGRLRDLRVEGRAPSVWEVRPPDASGTSVRIRSPGFLFGGAGECPGGGGDRMVLSSFSTTCVGGAALEDLNPKLGEYFGTSRGVLVTDVDDDSTLGLEPGDVILDVGGREATDAGRVRRILASYEGDEAITLHIMRQKREMTVQGSLGR